MSQLFSFRVQLVLISLVILGMVLLLNPFEADSGYYLELAEEAQNQRDHALAVFYYQKVVAAGADTDEVYFRLGQNLAAIGQRAEAIAAYEQAFLKGYTASAIEHLTVGWAYHQTGQWGEAIEHYQAAIDLKPDANLLGEIYLKLGWALQGNRQGEAAQQVFELAIQTGSQRVAGAYLELGDRAWQEGNYAAAVEDYQMGIKMLENYPQQNWVGHLPVLYSRLGRAWLELGDNEAAIKALETAIDLDANRLEDRFSLAQLQFSRQNYAAALTQYQAILEIMGREPVTYSDQQIAEVYLLLAKTYQAMGVCGQAGYYANRVLNLMPENTAAQNLRAACD
jgi:tetratricopeptide (TPR) repeat protein